MIFSGVRFVAHLRWSCELGRLGCLCGFIVVAMVVGVVVAIVRVAIAKRVEMLTRMQV